MNPLSLQKVKAQLVGAKDMVAEEIPREIAIKLCNEIQTENQRKRFSFGKRVCYFCCKYAKGDVEKMCLSGKQGCPQVSKRYRLQKDPSLR